jgi:hemin uptake protein HemP
MQMRTIIIQAVNTVRTQQHPAKAAEALATKVAPVSRITGEQLLGTSRELLIEHRGETYRLNVTRNGKLILTK